MNVSEVVRAGCDRIVAESDPAWWKAEEETRLAINDAAGPVEVRKLADDVRAAVLEAGPEGETPEQGELRYENWLRGS